MRICETQRSYNALQYRLMSVMLKMEINISKCDETTKLPLDKRVSASEFYRYRIMARENELCYLFSFRKLLNHSLIDMSAKVETELNLT